MSIAAQAVSRPPTVEESLAAILPLPPSLRRLLLRQLLQQLFPDADAYFFTDQRQPIRQRLRQALNAVVGPVVVVGHSLGTVIAYDVLSEAAFAARAVPLLVTLGSPLGYTEIQDPPRSTPTRPRQPRRAAAAWDQPADRPAWDRVVGPAGTPPLAGGAGAVVARAASGGCRCGGTETRGGGSRSSCWPVRSSAATGSTKPAVRPPPGAPVRSAQPELHRWA